MQIIKKRREKGRRAENLGVNPHSKGLNFSRSIFSLNLKKFPKNNKIKDNIIIKTVNKIKKIFMSRK